MLVAARIAPVVAALVLAGCAAHGGAGADRRGPNIGTSAGADAGADAKHDPARGSPVEVARAFYGALHRGDARSAARLVETRDADRALGALVTLAGAYQALEAALRDRFGPDAARVVGYSDRVASEEAALARARFDVDGDRAVVRAGDQTLAVLRRGEAGWRILLEDALSTEEGVAALVREAETSRVAAARVSPAIRGGLFDAAEDAVEAFRNDVALGMEGARPELPRAPEPAGVEL